MLSSSVCYSNVVASQHPCEVNGLLYLAFMAIETPVQKEDKRLDKLNYWFLLYNLTNGKIDTFFKVCVWRKAAVACKFSHVI